RFIALAEIDLDLSELREQVEYMDERLEELMDDVEQAMGHGREEDEDEGYQILPDEPEDGLDPADEQRIEELFAQAQFNRSKAYELKRTLDQLNVFEEYEDRFLDLFKKVD